MRAHFKKSLAALLCAAAVTAPVSAEAKGDKGGGKHEAGEQRRGGGGENHGGERKQRDAFNAPRFEQRAERAHRDQVVFTGRENPQGKRAQRWQRESVPVLRVADGPRVHGSAKANHWKEGRSSRSVERQRTRLAEAREFAEPRFSRKGHGDFKSERKFEKIVAKQQRAAYRAEEKQERRWAKEQRRTFKQASRIAPVVIYDRSFVEAPRPVRYADTPLYLAPEVMPYRSYASGYSTSPRYLANDPYSYAGSYYPQSYAALPGYSPYDTGYGDNGLGGLLGTSGGGLGDILVTLLPSLLGGGLGLGGFSTDQLGAGLLGSGFGTSDYAGGYEPYHQPGLGDFGSGYPDPFQDAYAPGGSDASSSLLGGDGLMSLLEVALGSGLLGGDFGGLGNLGGLGGVLGADSGVGAVDPVYTYADPYANTGGLLSGWGT